MRCANSGCGASAGDTEASQLQDQEIKQTFLSARPVQEIQERLQKIAE
jgi:hypothetical protein